MEYVTVERTRDGFFADPSAYLARLPGLAPALPPGALAFATDPEHYRFGALRFVKNLKPQTLTAGETDGHRWLELRLRHNCWCHEEDLTIRYTDPQRPAGVEDLTSDVSGLVEVLLDEVLPHEAGVSHEIVCVGGALTIVCRDLTASWSLADCPERA